MGRPLKSDECYYYVSHQELPTGLSRVQCMLRALEEMGEENGVNLNSEPLEVWLNPDSLQWGFFIGDTSTLSGDGWERRL